MSLSFFSGRTRTAVEAGFALNITSSLVKGLMPLRAFVAGLRTVLIFNKPGRTKMPTPFFLMCASITSAKPSSTEDTCLRLSSVLVAICSRIWLLVCLTLIGVDFFAMHRDSRNYGPMSRRRSVRTQKNFNKSTLFPPKSRQEADCKLSAEKCKPHTFSTLPY